MGKRVGAGLALLLCAFLGYSPIGLALATYSTEDLTAEPMIYGPEFTFATFSGNSGAGLVSSYIQNLDTHLVQNQHYGAKFIRQQNFFESPNGWGFNVKTDPGVIEVTMSPMTVEQYAHFASDIQDAIFMTAYNTGLAPALFLGGGHISISLHKFNKNSLLLRNFIVDFLNHNELHLGAWNYDTQNCVSPSLFSDEAISAIKVAISEYDRLDKDAFSDRDLNEKLMDPLSKAFGTLEAPSQKAWGQHVNGKNTALNFGRRKMANEAARLEIRAFRPQTSIYTFINQIRLIDKRIQFLETIKTPIAYAPRVKVKENLDFINGDAKLTPPVDPQEALRSFYIYVRESGEKWRDHNSYLWPAWVTAGEVTKFEASNWFKARQYNCAALLRR